MKTLTVFTPTYNRKHTLPRTYESLCRQTCRDFDWLVIDDGSTDGTREWIESLGEKTIATGPKFDWMGRVVTSEELGVRSEECTSDDHFFIQTPNLRIEYIYKPNGGLYTGYNVAYQTIQTELCVCIDSDDFMPDDAVEKILALWRKHYPEGSANHPKSAITHREYCGIVGLDFNITTKEAIGGHFPEDLEEVYFLSLHHDGDTKPVFRTRLMKKVAPMIGFEGERDFNPDYLQMQVFDKYPSLLLNDFLCCVEYQIGADSMSQGIFKQYVRSPRSYAKYRLMEMQMKHGMTIKRKMMLHMHYVASCIISHDKDVFKNSNNLLASVIAAPFAICEVIYIKIKTA